MGREKAEKVFMPCFLLFFPRILPMKQLFYEASQYENSTFV